jgi:hypothetical protein
VPSLLWQIFVGSFFAAQRLDAQGPGRLWNEGGFGGSTKVYWIHKKETTDI